jgi:hypothetical protein
VPQPSGTAQLDALVAEQLEAARRAQLGPGADSAADDAAGAEAEAEPTTGKGGSAGT